MLPILDRELGDKKKWLTSEELMDYYAIGQSTPGIIAVNVATFCGYKRAGIIGGITATLGVVCPSVIIITAIAGLINSFNEIVYVKKALMGINAAVAANLTYAFFNLTKKTVKNILGVFIFAGAFVSVYFFKVEIFIIVLVSIAIGVSLFYMKKHKEGGMIKR
ncbi:chromate transporter [Treponema sp.]|uniref:chromate transporter n=1 Tax=Treponema sp. TaxID=166 RepID=UPI00388D6DA6